MALPTAYVSRPHVLVSGQDEARLGERVVAALVEETIEGLYRCEITVANFGPTASGRIDYLYFGRDMVDFGSAIELRLGPGDPPETVFKGLVSALEADYPEGGGAQVTILAEDRFQGLRMTRRTRSFEDMSDADVIEQVAREHSLQSDVSLPGPTYRSLAQVNQSDLAFIRERARSVGGELWMDDTTLHAQPRTDRDGGRVELAYGGALMSFTVRADLAHQCTELGVSGWDVAAKDAIEETADDSALSSELGGDTSGSSILRDAFGARQERVVHPVPLTGEEARDIAEARYRERARRFVTGTGVADGNPALRVGATVTLSELGDLFDGAYYVVRTVHLYDTSRGYRTQFDVERPGIGQA